MFLFLLACTAQPEATVTVLAASSLTDAFRTMETAFEDAHPGVDVQLSFAGSQTLATQVRHGIRADVVTTANVDHMDDLVAEGLVGAAHPIAGNTLAMAVRPQVEPVTLQTLPDRIDSLVVGHPSVPVGAYTATFLDRAERQLGVAWRQQLDARVVSREPNARLVMAKVTLGEADAAVVYATDIPDELVEIPIPEDLSPSARYLQAPLAAPPGSGLSLFPFSDHEPLADPADRDLAIAWMRWVESSAGQQILRAHGFQGADGS